MKKFLLLSSLLLAAAPAKADWTIAAPELFALRAAQTALRDRYIAPTEAPVPNPEVTSEQRAVRVGEVFTVILEQNASTGYAWEVSRLDAGLLKLLDVRTIPQSPRLPGSSTTVVFRFQALAPGETTVSLDYRRTWDRISEPRRIHLVKAAILN